MDTSAPAGHSEAALPLSAENVLDLLDWKRTVFELYARIRGASDSKAAHDE